MLKINKNKVCNSLTKSSDQPSQIILCDFCVGVESKSKIQTKCLAKLIDSCTKILLPTEMYSFGYDFGKMSLLMKNLKKEENYS